MGGLESNYISFGSRLRPETQVPAVVPPTRQPGLSWRVTRYAPSVFQRLPPIQDDIAITDAEFEALLQELAGGSQGSWQAGALPSPAGSFSFSGHAS